MAPSDISVVAFDVTIFTEMETEMSEKFSGFGTGKAKFAKFVGTGIRHLSRVAVRLPKIPGHRVFWGKWIIIIVI